MTGLDDGKHWGSHFVESMFILQFSTKKQLHSSNFLHVRIYHEIPPIPKQTLKLRSFCIAQRVCVSLTTIFDFVSETTGYISMKLGKKHPWAGTIQICSCCRGYHDQVTVTWGCKTLKKFSSPKPTIGKNLHVIFWLVQALKPIICTFHEIGYAF